jgi:molybdopterin synthase sulfur carrier subunit
VATVHIPTALRALAGGAEWVEVPGGTLRQVIDALDARYPGVRAEVVVDGALRPELAVSIDGVIAERGLVEPVPEGAEVYLIAAIGGGAAAGAGAGAVPNMRASTALR